MDRSYDRRMTRKPGAIEEVKSVVAGEKKSTEVGSTARKLMRQVPPAELREAIERSPTTHSQFRHRPSTGALRRTRSA